jgi:hypothetical protein
LKHAHFLGRYEADYKTGSNEKQIIYAGEKLTVFMYPMIMQVIVSQIAHSQWCITIGHVGGAESNISSLDSEL